MQKQPVILPDVMSSKSLKCKGKSTPFAGTLPCKCKHKAPLWVARAWFDQLNPNQLGFDPLRLLACWADKTKKYAVVKQGHLVWPSWPMSYGHLAKGRAIYKRLSSLS